LPKTKGGAPRRKRAAGDPLRIVFLGNVAFPPNADAIDFFAEQILPALRARAGEVRFDVIGCNATEEMKERYASRVTFRGFVDDLGAAFADYDLLAAPIRYGGGTKLKVLDAMAYRIPVVTTGVGAEGLCIEHGKHALLAESAPSFVEA